MGAVTFPEPKVVDFLTENVVAVRLPHDHRPLAEQFQVKWTPTLVTLDSEGKEHHRTVGFLPPEELVPSLLLGRGKIHFDHEEFEEALRSLDAILKEYPKSDAAPEAIFLRGVSLYKSTQDPKPLKQAYEKLQAEYPESEWTKRALPYRLIP
ncbi:MAG: tetratricopeptide repeat protein [Deltaproteobacteria bacterium]|nr:tetratricopeptide repeat protein [Deltaproteobacteria bacterium]